MAEPEEKPQEIPQEKKKKKELMSENEKRIRNIAVSYYARGDIQKYLVEFSKNREVVPRYFEGFGKRPDTLQYPSEVFELVKRGATSFHSSQELWQDPLQIATEMAPEQLNNLKIGWDLLLDIDSKYIDYSKIAAELLIKKLKEHGVNSVGVKFSGSKGFHIIVPFSAFPKQINNVPVKDMFPELARIVTKYLQESIKTELIKRISQLSISKSQQPRHSHALKYIRGESKEDDFSKDVAPDLVLVSPRHLFRMPYSLHEKTSLASVVIDKNKIAEFELSDANPLKAKPRPFILPASPNETQALFREAFDWHSSQFKEDKQSPRANNYSGQQPELILKSIDPEFYPPCIASMLKGINDGKKRALFALINYFKFLNLPQDVVEKHLAEWNQKNNPQLKEGYIRAQLSWAAKNRKMLPPNCREFYQGIGVCSPDNFCKFVKNPLNYTARKYRMKNSGRPGQNPRQNKNSGQNQKSEKEQNK